MRSGNIPGHRKRVANVFIRASASHQGWQSILLDVFTLKSADITQVVLRSVQMMRFGGEVKGIITAAAIQFSPDNTVQITADFVTTGALRLRMEQVKCRMLSCKRTLVTYAWIKTAALNCCYSRIFNGGASRPWLT